MMTATLNALLPNDGAEAEGPVVIDPKYEYICAPKYFDFAKDERAEDIVAVEAWFEQAPADTESRQSQISNNRWQGWGVLIVISSTKSTSCAFV